METEEAAVDNCPERVDAADARPSQIETAMEFWSGMGVETAVGNCPERVNVVDAEAAESIRSEAGMALEAVVALERMHAAGLTMRGFFWCSCKKRNKKKQELAAG